MTTETLPPMPGLAPVDPRAAAQAELDKAVKNLADEKAKVEHAKTAKVQAQAILDAAKPNIMLAEAAVTVAKAHLLQFGPVKAEGGDKVTCDQVVAILRAAPSQMTVEDIRAALAEQGVNADANNLKVYMSRWSAAGAVLKGEKNNRLEPARYYAPVVNGAAPPMPGLNSNAGTPLPEDFPGREWLEKAGHTTLETVPSDADGLTAISGIGKATAKAILEALG